VGGGGGGEGGGWGVGLGGILELGFSVVGGGGGYLVWVVAPFSSLRSVTKVFCCHPRPTEMVPWGAKERRTNAKPWKRGHRLVGG